MGKPKVPIPRSVAYTKAFIKDWKRLSQAVGVHLAKMREVMWELIKNDQPLAENFRDHALEGE